MKQVRSKTRDRKGKEVIIDDHSRLWQIDGVPGGISLIVAGTTAISGRENQVSLTDVNTRKAVSSRPVDAIPYALAAAAGQRPTRAAGERTYPRRHKRPFHYLAVDPAL